MSPRTTRLAQFAVSVVMLGWIAYVLWSIAGGFALDFHVYMSIAHRVLDGGPLYTADQLAGPHVTMGGDNVYPPTSFPLFLAFALIPDPVATALWFAIPLTVAVWYLRRVRPGGWRIVGMLALMCWPTATATVFLGNPVLWSLAALCAGLVYRWPVAFAVVKPVMGIFVVIGLRDRRTWYVLAGFAVLGLLTMPAMLDWLRVLLNLRGEFSGPSYLFGNLPLMLVPIVAGTRKPAPAAGGPPGPAGSSAGDAAVTSGGPSRA